MPNFIENYMTLTSGDECPENYHLWSGISTLASVIGKRVWINWGRFKVDPHLYIILLGPPALGKTTSMGVSKRMLRELGTVPFSAECQTKESLCKEWKGYERAFETNGKTLVYTPISILVTEFSHFLGPNSGHMIDFLTTAFDSGDFYDTKTKNKENDIIIGPCINLLACTTPTWITTYLKSDIITGGFTRRALFVNEEDNNKRIPFPDITVSQAKAGEDAINYLRTLSVVGGEFTWDVESRSFFADWYVKYQLPTDLTVRWYHKFKHILAIKVAMLFCLADGSNLVMKRCYLEMALDALGRLEPNLTRVFQGMGRNELHTVANKLLDILKMAGGSLPEKQLDRIMSREANSRELFEVKTNLLRCESVEQYKEKMPNGVEKLMIRLK